MRYLIGRWLNHPAYLLPYGTLLVNILGSLLIGFVIGFVARSSSFTENHALILATGFCGGFTTFSAFALENQLFLKSGDYGSFVGYTLASVLLGLLAVFIGLYLSKIA